jgi:hypothetical protein
MKYIYFFVLFSTLTIQPKAVQILVTHNNKWGHITILHAFAQTSMGCFRQSHQVKQEIGMRPSHQIYATI